MKENFCKDCKHFGLLPYYHKPFKKCNYCKLTNIRVNKIYRVEKHDSCNKFERR